MDFDGGRYPVALEARVGVQRVGLCGLDLSGPGQRDTAARTGEERPCASDMAPMEANPFAPLDRRHFGVLCPRPGDALRLISEGCA